MADFKRKRLAAEDDRLKGITLAELAHTKVDVFFCWCNRCSHSAVFTAALLVAELGPVARHG